MPARTAAARTGRLWSAALRRLAERRSVVLGYHGIGTAPARDDLFRLLVSPQEFTMQLELLLAAGFRFVTVAELAEHLDGDRPPRGLATVSFDDGLRDNYTTALPILRQFGIRATVYPVVGFLGGHSPWISPGPAGEILSEDELRALAAEGWEIGAHTMTHPDLSKLDYAACRSEIEESRDALQRITGQSIRTFAYPFGYYDQAAVAAARDTGFRAAVTTGSGSWAPLELTRAMVSARDPFPVLMLKLTDRYEPLLSSPPLRLLRQASKQIRSGVGGRSHGDDAGPPGPSAG